jgi:tripartite-type tricarboxylate transporter receptor subunit TctC
MTASTESLLRSWGRRIFRLSAGSCLFLFAFEAPVSAADFYKDKTISMMVSGAGTYEVYARLIAKTMPKYIPGNPVIVVKPMSGAGGLKVANYIYNVAPKDGTEIGAVHSHIPTITFFQKEGAQYDPTQFSWIGNASAEVFIGYMWHTSPVQSLDEARVKESIVGGGSRGTGAVDLAVLANAMAGTKFKIVTGYATSQNIQLAVERGEVNGHFGTSWSNISSGRANWLREGKIKVITQFGREKAADLQDVPLITSAVSNPDDRKAFEIFLSRQDTGKPFFGPPGMPKDRLEILRTAFTATLKDPTFLQDAQKAELEAVSPMSGEEMDAFVKDIFKSPPAYAKRINDILEDFGKTH